MPAAAAAIAKAAAYFVYEAGATYGVAQAAGVIVYAAVIAAEVVAYNAALKALTPGQKNPEATPRTQAIADGNAPAKLIIGTVTVGGAHVIPPIVTTGYATSGASYAGVWTHRLQVFAAHEVDSIADVYAEQTRIPSSDISALAGTLDDGRVVGSTKYASGAGERRLMLRRYTGTATQNVDYILHYVDAGAFSNDFRLRGYPYLAVTAAYDAAFPNGMPPFAAVVHGAKGYDPRKDSTNGGSGTQRYNNTNSWGWHSNPILAQAWLAMLDPQKGGGGYDPALDFNWPLIAASANLCDALVPTAPFFFNLVTSGSISIAGNAVLKGATATAGWNASVYSTDTVQKGSISATPVMTNGLGQAMFGFSSNPTADASYTSIDYAVFFSSEVQIYEFGSLVYDTLAVVDDKTWARIDYDGTYMVYWVNGKVVRTVKVPSAFAAYALDTSVYDPGGGLYINYGPRYTANIELDTSKDFEGNMKLLADCCLGRYIERDGILQLYAGAWDTPTFVINESDWMGTVQIQAVGPRRDSRWNGVRCWYYDVLRNNQRVESYARTNDIYKAADNGERIWVEIEQPGCNNESEAQRKGEFILRQSRNGIKITGTLPARFQYLALWETGVINSLRLGWTSKTFRLTSYNLNPDASVTCSFSEEQAADWDDLASNQDGTPSLIQLPNTNETTPTAPRNLSVTPDYGLVRFQWDPSVVAPVGMNYRLVRSVTTLASSYDYPWTGDALRTDIKTDPNSGHYYFVQAVSATGSYTSPLCPNTFGIFGKAWPNGSAYGGNTAYVDGDMTYGTNSYWLEIGAEVAQHFGFDLTTGFLDNVGLGGAKVMRFLANSKNTSDSNFYRSATAMQPLVNRLKASDASSVAFLNGYYVPVGYGNRVTLSAALRLNAGVVGTDGVKVEPFTSFSFRADAGSGYTTSLQTVLSQVFSAQFLPTAIGSIQFFTMSWTISGFANGLVLPPWVSPSSRNLNLDILKWQVYVS